MSDSTDTWVRTLAGTVRGTVLDTGVRRFLGIPYAEPPFGRLRFAPPVRREPWDGEHDGRRPGAIAGQRLPDAGSLMPGPGRPGEDHLNLNVWAPAEGEGLPVMVFIHGGSFITGSGAIGGYDGARFARDGVVLVTINYRLGAEGFGWFGDGPANLGLRDQIGALEWVRDSIAAFGGDPTNVTVFGESAGAMSIGSLLAIERARPLFRRAILQSGSGAITQGPDATRRVSRLLARMLRVPPTPAGLAQADPARLLAVQGRVAALPLLLPTRRLWGDAAAHTLIFAPTIDGDLLTGDPLQALRDGVADDIELLVGWNRQEANLFLGERGPDRAPSWLSSLLRRKAGLPKAQVEAYRRAHPDASPGALTSAIVTDWYYRVPAIRTAEAHPRTHLYEFDWHSPAHGGTLGAAHAVELPFVFDNLDSPDWSGFVGENPPQALADDMHGAWVAFARGDGPGWEPYTADRRVVQTFAEPSGPRLDPDAVTRGVWDGLR